jgi:hypothetical protein
MRSIEGEAAGELTVMQRRFADESKATPGMRCGRDRVCMYRSYSDVLIRWIVDSAGSIVETTAFLTDTVAVHR